MKVKGCVNEYGYEYDGDESGDARRNDWTSRMRQQRQQ